MHMSLINSLIYMQNLDEVEAQMKKISYNAPLGRISCSRTWGLCFYIYIYIDIDWFLNKLFIMLDYNQKCAMNEDFNYFNLTFWERERHPPQWLSAMSST